MDLVNALWITLLGMGLVFIVILVLWGLMELVVRLTARSAKEEIEETVEIEDAEEAVLELIPAEQDEKKKLAAVVAVAFALAKAQQPAAAGVVENKPYTVSAWQSVARANMMHARAAIFSRKSNGNVR